jgi:acetyl-CoA carboxylase carboxyl transferase subunit beta
MNEAGLPYVTVLANPATGQAFGSFANLADIIMAEPGAIVGFSPFGVLKRASDEPMSTESHTAESRLEHGLLDAVVDRRELRTVLGVLLDLLGPRYRLERADDRGPNKPTDVSRAPAWDSVQLSRLESRPTSGDYMKMMFSNFVELHGDRSHGDDSSIVCGIAQLAGQTVMAIGQERGGDDISRRITQNGRTRPEGFRKAQRGMRLAAKFNMPIVTLIDTPGPDLSQDAEQRGLGNAIASTMALMARLDVTSVSVIIGEAGSGGALALGVADRTLMLEHATYSAVSPEEAAEVIYQDRTRADEAAESMKLTAYDCRDLGIIDTVVPEPSGGAHLDPGEAARQLRRMIVSELVSLQSRGSKKMQKDRYKKYRNIGEYSSYFSAALTRDVNALQNLFAACARWITRRSAPADHPPEPPKTQQPE